MISPKFEHMYVPQGLRLRTKMPNGAGLREKRRGLPAERRRELRALRNQRVRKVWLIVGDNGGPTFRPGNVVGPFRVTGRAKGGGYLHVEGQRKCILGYHGFRSYADALLECKRRLDRDILALHTRLIEVQNELRIVSKPPRLRAA